MQGKCRVLLRNGFDIMTTMIVQNTVFTTDFVLIERFDDCGFLLGGIEKKMENRLALHSAGQMQSYPSK